ncbi:hypothetical protein [Streptomyces lushanensis]|uniref:hypothetical protein n=1 Tax=Streptomyces lushanensis TaxID=1434255 RepID=UPI0008330EEA
MSTLIDISCPSLADARRHGGLSKAGADAPAGIGTDVDRIVSKAEEAHGEGALRAVGATGRRRRRWPGHRGFTPGAKGVLERSPRIAAGRGDRHIGDEHVLLALAARPQRRVGGPGGPRRDLHHPGASGVRPPPNALPATGT